MKILLLLSLFLLACSDKAPEKMAESADATTAEASANKNYFGAAPSMEGDAITMTAAVNGEMVDKPIKMASHVTNVCKKKGCWMTLTEGETEVRVTFKDYGFFVPLDFQDVDVVLEGVLSRKLIKEDERRHYAEDQGKSKEEIEAIVGDTYEYTFEATSVLKV